MRDVLGMRGKGVRMAARGDTKVEGRGSRIGRKSKKRIKGRIAIRGTKAWGRRRGRGRSRRVHRGVDVEMKQCHQGGKTIGELSRIFSTTLFSALIADRGRAMLLMQVE
jgi:hypothetical protein